MVNKMKIQKYICDWEGVEYVIRYDRQANITSVHIRTDVNETLTTDYPPEFKNKIKAIVKYLEAEEVVRKNLGMASGW